MPDLDPKLQALQQRLIDAVSNDTLAFDATTLGADGAAIISLFRSTLDEDAVIVSGNVSITPSGSDLLVAADFLQTPIGNTSTQSVRAFFSVADSLLGAQIHADGGTDWTFASCFPQLSATWAGLFEFKTDADDSTQVILANARGILAGGTLEVVEGINLKATLGLSSGPAQTITTLIAGLGSSINVIGPAVITPTFESLEANASVADFPVTLPVVGTLEFQNSQLSLHTLNGDHLGGMLYDAYYQVSSHVALGGISLPLMMRAPYVDGDGWTFGTIPGESIPVSDLATFFAALTGLDFLAKLPENVQPLSKFELDYFVLKLNSDFTDYSNLCVGFSTPDDDVSDNSWTIIQDIGNDPILKLTGLRMVLEVDHRGQNTTYSGEIAGSASISSTLSLECIIPLPANTGLWRFSAYSQQTLPNLVDFSRLIGGRALADLLPQQLGVLTSFNLNSLLLTYNPLESSFTNFSIGMSSAQPWVIVEDWLSIDAVGFNMSLDAPLSSSSKLTGAVTGQITLGTDAHILVQVARSAPEANWRLSVSTRSIELPSLSDLATLANGDISDLVPEQIRDSHFTFSDVLIEADISARQMQAFAFTLSTTDTWTLITDVLAITEVGVTLDLRWPSGTRQISGVIWGDVSFCQANFYLEADYADSSWNLQVKLIEGSELTLENLADTFDASLWPALSELGLPNIAITSAAISYATATGNYSFSGSIGPALDDQWLIPVGISNIEIKGLGAEVSCTRESDGSAGDKKVYITGNFKVGSVNFTVSYLAGSNLTIDCALVGNDPISVEDMVGHLCEPDASDVTWASGVEALDSMQISKAHAKLVLGEKPTLEIYGKITFNDVDINCLFVVREISDKWEFAFAISIEATWSLPGFTDAFAAFNLDSSSWMIAASSFTDTGFAFPPGFPTPDVAVIERGLDFYASLKTSETLNTISSVQQALPSGSLADEFTIHGLLAAPLSDSFLEVIISSDPAGVPLFGMQEVKLQTLALRLTATPAAFGLHGVFLFDAVKNPDGSALSSGISVDLLVSATDVTLNFGPPPGETYIFKWQDAFGITSLTIELDQVGFNFAWKPVAIGGAIAGKVTFESSEAPLNTLLRHAPPSPASVAFMDARREILLSSDANKHGYLENVDYSQFYDRDGIVVEMAVSFEIILAGEVPVPYPKKLAGHFVNFTLPYILHRFASIDLPDLLMPVQFPDVQFYLELPDPEHIGTGSNIVFDFKGKLIVFGLHGEIDAHFDATRVMFSAEMDPVLIPSDGSIVSITAEDDKTKGVELYLDTSPPTDKNNIYGTFELAFFGMEDFKGDISLSSATDPTNTKLKFHVQGIVGSLASMELTFVYQDLDYLKAAGSVELNLTADGLSGFSMSKDGNTFKMADSVDFSKASSTGLEMGASISLTLDARNPSTPDFKLAGDAHATLNISAHCQLPINVSLDIDVNKDTFTMLPLTIAEQALASGASVFGGILSHAPGCFTDLLKLGVFVLSEVADVAKVLVHGFEMGVDLIEEGAKLLSDIGSAVGDVADALWSIFGSNDSKNNTAALQSAGYGAEETAEAIKNTQDKEQPSNPYTAQDLVHDQASSGYQAPQVAGSLVTVFSSYGSQPVASGQLLSNQQLTSYTPTHVSNAMRSQYPNDTKTAAKMTTLLSQVYTASATLTAQQMADALAPLYPANEVAAALRQQYRNDTDTAAKMAALLVPAYQTASHPLAVADLAGALAPLYGAVDVSAVLHTDFPSDTDTAAKLGAILKTAYASGSPTIDAPGMSLALAPIFTTPADIVGALQSLYPSDSNTATKMAAILKPAYPDMNVGAMAAALTTGQYPVGDIAAVLEHFYGADAGTPELMTALLASQKYTPIQVAPVLTTLWPSECDTAAKVATILLGGFPADSITAPTMATALKIAGFDATAVAPALKNNYASDTATASDMATLLINTYQDGSGANTISGAEMAKVLKAAPYYANTTAGTGQALLTNYASDVATALDMSKLLAGGPYTAAEIARALTEFYASSVTSATNLATIFAATPFTASISAPVIKTSFPSDVSTASDMYMVLSTAWATPALTGTQMAGALAVSPYEMADTAPVLKSNYTAETTTATEMYALLQAAYTNPTTTAAQMAGALANSPYEIADTALILKTNYTEATKSASDMYALLHAAYTNPVPTAAQMAGALSSSTYGIADTAPVLKTNYAEATTTASDMYSLLQTAYASAAPTVAQMANALAASPYEISDAAPVLKTNYMSATASAADMYTLLQAAYTNPAPIVAQMAGALAAAPYAVTEVAPLLKTNYPSEAGNAGQLTPILKTAYASIELTGMMQALAASEFNALDIAAPIRTAFNAASVEEMGQSLAAAFTGNGSLTSLPLGVALSTASYNAGDVAKGVKAGIDNTSAGLMAAILTLVSDSELPAAITETQSLRIAGTSMVDAAPQVVSKVSGISGSILITDLGSVYMPPKPALGDLLDASVAAFDTPDVNSISQGVLAFLPCATSEQLLVALLAAYSASSKTISNIEALTAVTSAFAFIGKPINQGDFGALYLSLDDTATPTTVTAAIVAAYETKATAASLITALKTAYADSNTIIDARASAIAITSALKFSDTDADRLLFPLADGFGLSTCPNDVGALGVALNTSGYSLNSASAAMAGYWSSSWTPDAYQILASIYSNPAWATAITQRENGLSITAAAPVIYAAHTKTNSALMVQILAAVYDLSTAANAITPMANALKIIILDGKKAYTLNEASAAMSAQYSPDWTPDDWQQFQAIFNS